MAYSTPGIPVLHYLLKFAQTHVHRVNDVIQPSHHPVTPFSCPQSFPSTRVFSNESALLITQPKDWSFSISPSNEYSGLFPLGLTGLILLSKVPSRVFPNLKASILYWSAFFMIQLSHPDMTTGKTIALTKWTFGSKVMSLLFNMLPRFVLAFIPRSKCLLISWLQLLYAVILEAKETKIFHCFHFFPFYLP